MSSEFLFIAFPAILILISGAVAFIVIYASLSLRSRRQDLPDTPKILFTAKEHSHDD